MQSSSFSARLSPAGPWVAGVLLIERMFCAGVRDFTRRSRTAPAFAACLTTTPAEEDRRAGRQESVVKTSMLRILMTAAKKPEE